MKITIDYIEKAFEKYNNKYFKSKLPTPIFKISREKNCLGRFSVVKSSLLGTIKSMTLIVSNFYDLSERDFDDTIIHEMIHEYIFVNGIQDTNDHGIYWLAKAKEINKDGWNIRAKASFDVTPQRNGNSKTEYKILTFEDRNGKPFVMRCADNKVMYFQKLIKRNGFTNPCLIISNNDDKFMRFTCCRTKMKGQYVDKIGLAHYMANENVISLVV
jgi:hypothetical protein